MDAPATLPSAYCAKKAAKSLRHTHDGTSAEKMSILPYVWRALYNAQTHYRYTSLVPSPSPTTGTSVAPAVVRTTPQP
eukprot:CAMPEP_0174944446 /NCGR_PEP_ID=MMETSP1355-20121228/79159_1 /TAXON_ID=464990 /ORGANISM="Hemiselmis tepida, Strain CCMP443" /LENGTH=77 /DNA_ID=CAMNT_0016191749 /DNA_START=85 /DNA_END=315 /DNA_ORIENTATION=-